MGIRKYTIGEARQKRLERNHKRAAACKLDPACLEKKRKAERENYRRLRQTFLDMYGRKCACCGENHEEFLVLDHIEGQHGKKRDQPTDAYKKAIAYHQPRKYRTLCQNCNHSLGVRGYCPHQCAPRVAAS